MNLNAVAANIVSAINPFTRVQILQSTGPVTRAGLADVERYAVTDFLLDAIRGERDADAIAKTLDTNGCDLLVAIGGTGVGRSDATAMALAQRGALVAHGVALQPGRTVAIGRIGQIPVIALAGAPDQALAAWWTLALPVLDRLSGRKRRRILSLPLARKIASQVGIAEIALLQRGEGLWTPLAVGDLPLEIIARADAWLLVPGGSEGFAAGTPVDAYMLRQ